VTGVPHHRTLPSGSRSVATDRSVESSWPSGHYPAVRTVLVRHRPLPALQSRSWDVVVRISHFRSVVFIQETAGGTRACRVTGLFNCVTHRLRASPPGGEGLRIRKADDLPRTGQAWKTLTTRSDQPEIIVAADAFAVVSAVG
jgi:hypothetical protein